MKDKSEILKNFSNFYQSPQISTIHPQERISLYCDLFFDRDLVNKANMLSHFELVWIQLLTAPIFFNPLISLSPQIHRRSPSHAGRACQQQPGNKPKNEATVFNLHGESDTRF